MYEQFRNKIILSLSDSLSADQLKTVMAAIDEAASGYDITQKTTSLIVQGGIPDIVKLYLTSRAIEGLSKSTLKTYNSVFESFFSTMSQPIQMIMTNDIRVWLFNYQKDHGISNRSL